MKRVILLIVAVGLALVVAQDATAGPFSWLRRRTVTPTYVRPAPVATVRAEEGYRTFSYQPQPQATALPMYQTNRGRKMNAWDFPKTDARRYSGGN